ncbi:helix-turn-helix domain-containing protein, partial [Litchfieldella anticariensis]
MARYSSEFKLQVVLHHESPAGGSRRTAIQFGLDRGVVRSWVEVYRQHGEAGLARRTRPQVYDLAFKLKVVRFLE